jgi:hypothetical protein
MSAVETEMPVSAVTASPRRPTHVQSFSDLDLQLSRRLDWRFLLADTRLGNIAYIGKEKPFLVAGLEKFSDHLTIVSPKTLEALPATFDLAVVTTTTGSAFECAARILKDGGSIYVETGSTGVKAKLAGLNGHRATLLAAGFRDVGAYWHRPNFESCREIVPLDDTAALDYALSRQHADLAGKVKSTAARFATQAGLFRFIVPSISLIACKHSQR